jgi:hypothetical protein
MSKLRVWICLLVVMALTLTIGLLAVAGTPGPVQADGNPVGQALVDFYYSVSPPMAEFITEHPGLKPVVRAGLVPAVAMSTVFVNTTSAEKIAILGLFVLVSAAVAVWAKRRRGRGSEYT